MVHRVSDQNFTNLFISRIGTQKSLLTDYSRQLQTNQVYKDLGDMSPTNGDIQKFQFADQTIQRLTQYKSNITEIGSRLDQYEDVFKTFDSIISGMTSALSDTSIANNQGTSVMTSLADKYMTMVQDLLNTTVATPGGTSDKYTLFGGKDYQDFTVKFTLFGTMNAGIAPYDYASGGGPNPFPPTVQATQTAYNTYNGTVNTNYTNPLYVPVSGTIAASNYYTRRPGPAISDSNSNFQYELTTDETFIQQLVLGLDVARKATTTAATMPSGQPIQSSVTAAKNLLSQAKTAMDAMRSSMAAERSVLDSTSKLHDTQIAAFQAVKDDIDLVKDPNEVAAKLNTLQTQIQLNYQSTASISQLSFINYLS